MYKEYPIPSPFECLLSILVNGERHLVNCHNHSRDEVVKWVNLLRTQSGNQIIRLRKMWHTDCPSIQGPWSPFVNKDPEFNLADFPNVRLALIP
jgi:large subunit ribosomal protein L43